MAEIPEGYKDIPEEDRKKAQVFFDRGKTVADTGNFEYAIEMYIQGLRLDPESREAHQALRDISMRRKALGGKPMGMKDKWNIKKGDELTNLLNAEKLLAYDPGNTGHMVDMITGAQKAGCYDTVLFIGPILLRANNDDKKPDFNKYITLKNVYTAIGRFKLAVDAVAYAARMKPDDMDLQHDLRDLSTKETIRAGKYDSGESFRDSIRDMEGQKKLLEFDKDVHSADALAGAIKDAEAAWRANPEDPGKFTRLVDTLRKTEDSEYENRAIELLDQQYQKTKRYSFRQSIGQIKMAQLNRMDRSQRDALKLDPTNDELKKDYAQFLKDKTEEELRIFTETVENYPTDTSARFEMARRLFLLRRYEDAISVFQEVRSDPKYKGTASTYLGRAFLEAGFVDEAVDTLEVVCRDYIAKGDEKSLEMTYWLARSQEQKGDTPAALKNYSQVFQWNSRFKDVQARIKRLRAGPAT